MCFQQLRCAAWLHSVLCNNIAQTWGWAAVAMHNQQLVRKAAVIVIHATSVSHTSHRGSGSPRFGPLLNHGRRSGLAAAQVLCCLVD